MRTIFVVLLCVIGAIAHHDHSEEHPLVTAPIGRIRGSIMTTRLGKKIFSFRGVRYGESPTGHQRFQPPVPAEDWHNTFDASEEGPSCPHPKGKLTSEDCLRLNVYTTKLPCESENVSRPVMIFFHPGGFYSFSGQSHLFGPQYILDQDIVLVTVNYRLGALGFLNTGDSLAPGNMGLKDQVVAMRWVQRNIAAFGGNPNSVTLCGYSAGSFSIMLHMVSPMSRNLFHRVITMSASAVHSDNSAGVSYGQKKLSTKLARLLDCPTDSTGAMLLCLNTKPVENFTDTLDALFDWYGNPILLWQPAVEPRVRGMERFLTDQPYNLIKQGKFQQVPMILGATKDEFAGIASIYEKDGVNGNSSVYRDVDSRWNTLAPIIFMYERDTPRSSYISRELKQFYFGGQPLSLANNDKLKDLYADSIITFPMYRAAKIFSEASSKPVYFYRFTYQGRKSFAMWNDTTPYGVVHHDDLQYLFFMKEFFPYFDKDAPEVPMVELYTSMWSNFVKTGEPIPKNDERFNGITWDTFVPSRSNYLEINLHPTMKTGFLPERMRFWEQLFPLPTSRSNVKH